ncbi:MAG TPA: MBL fold metallo-hydrolase [Dehalococcoidia bacterium]|nr:MBL fold metallo-hydrolase [Dehalococcoidia bacterium]
MGRSSCAVLTDPNFLDRGEQVRLGFGLRSTRRTDPALAIADLPPLDLVVLSHLHDDHFDRVAGRELDQTLPNVTTGQAAWMLSRKGFAGAQGLQNWETSTFSKGNSVLRVTSMPAKHAPKPLQFVLPPAMGSLLEFQDWSGRTSLRLYISGDTLIHDDLKEISRRYPDTDLALLHLSGTRIFGVLLTMDAHQGVEALRLIGPSPAIPIHYENYAVFKSPLRHFRVAVREAGLADRVTYLGRGESFHLVARSAAPEPGDSVVPGADRLDGPPGRDQPSLDRFA